MLHVIKKIHTLQTPTQKRHYIFLQLLFCVTAAIQVAGVASLAPFIALLANPELIHTNVITHYFYDLAGFNTDTQFLMGFAVMVMLVIVISNAISGLSLGLMFSFSFRLGAELQNSIYREYLHKDFVFYSKNNSSRMINVLTQEVPRYVFMVVQPFLSLCSQLFVIILILGGLIYIDFTLALSATIIVGGGYLIVFRLLKTRLVAHGHNIWEINNRKLKLISESIGGVKEIRLLGTAPIYEKKLAEANHSGLRSLSLLGLAADIPKFFVETIALGALIGLALYLLAKYGSSPQVISMLSLYAMAGYKLLPAAQTVYKSISQIKANGSVIEEFYDDTVKGRSIPHAPEIRSEKVSMAGNIELRNVAYTYPDVAEPALRNINLTIKRNSIVSLVGNSGAGKSTLADILLGMLTPTGGDMSCGDTAITRNNIATWQSNLGYVPQNIFIFDDTIAANIAFGIPKEKIDLDKLRTAAKMANIDAFIDSLPGQFDYVVGERGAMLSGGQRQRIGIARALYHDADILILDEATSALDTVNEAEIIATIQHLKSSKTIIQITHRLATIAASDMIVMLNNGQIEACGAYTELAQSSDKFRNMLHLDLKAQTT